MSFGKTIRIYLADGQSTGPVVAEIINWTGQVVVVPRPKLAELARRESLQRTGVYLLIGPDTHTSQSRMYVGEGDEVFARLKAHDKDESKEFWTHAITVTSKDDNLTKAHGRYLEGRLIELAAAARRVILSNGTAPPAKALPEPDVADMEYFLDQIMLMLPVLGFDVLRPLPTPTTYSTGSEANTLYLREAGVVAEARELDGVFTVLRGSTARRANTPAWDGYVGVRDALVAERKLVPKDELLFEFSDNVEFKSPSAAAAVVMAANRNGRKSWKLSDGRSYAEWKEAEIVAAESGH